MFTYIATFDTRSGATGNMFVSNDINKIPSKSYITTSIEKDYKFTDVVITNIFEFKNEEDYNNFIN